MQEEKAQYGRMLLIASLQKACAQWEPVRVPGRDNVADTRWNVGLAAEGFGEPDDLSRLKTGLTNMIGGQTLEAEAEEERRRAALRKAAAEQLEAERNGSPEARRASGRFCYHCATQDPPIRAAHPFVDCPKRRKACVREYTAEAMQQAVEELRVSREACQAVLDKQGYALRENSGNKRVLLELGGALKVLTKQEKHRLPAPPPPPPPPNAERLFSWRDLARRRGHVRRHVLKLISRVGRHDRTAWGQLKSVALMVPDTTRFPLDPTWVLRVAGSLDLDLLGFRPEVGHALLPISPLYLPYMSPISPRSGTRCCPPSSRSPARRRPRTGSASPAPRRRSRAARRSSTTTSASSRARSRASGAAATRRRAPCTTWCTASRSAR